MEIFIHNVNGNGHLVVLVGSKHENRITYIKKIPFSYWAIFLDSVCDGSKKSVAVEWLASIPRYRRSKMKIIHNAARWVNKSRIQKANPKDHYMYSVYINRCFSIWRCARSWWHRIMPWKTCFVYYILLRSLAKIRNDLVICIHIQWVYINCFGAVGVTIIAVVGG